MELITDPLGGAQWKKSNRALRHTGRLGMFGASTATESSLPGPLKLLNVGFAMPWFNPVTLMNENRSVFGVNLGHLWHEAPKIAAWMSALAAGVTAGWVRSHVDRTFPLAQAGEAHAYISDLWLPGTRSAASASDFPAVFADRRTVTPKGYPGNRGLR